MNQDPEAFEKLLKPLHQAFLRASAIMAEIGPDGKNYWDILKAAQELLEAMGHVENAAFEWRSFSGRLDTEEKQSLVQTTEEESRDVQP